jgi:tripartite-type tricarboxylate transporter receptor subunit TctC
MIRITIAAASAAVIGCSLVGIAPQAVAQEWPDKPVRIVAPFAPGSTPDILARLLADNLAKNTKKTFIVENKAGAAGMIGTDAVAKAAPDGTTIGISIGGPLVNNTVLYKSMPYDPFRDLTPITLAVNQPCVLVASNASAIGSVKELVAELQKNPSKYTYGSFGNGTMSHLVMVMIGMQTNSQLVQVPYPGAPQVVQALVAGDVNLACIPAAPTVPQAKAGKLKVLGVASSKRFTLMPDVPTISEQGIKGIEANSWMGVVAPAKTPAPVLARMQAEIAKVLSDPEVIRTLSNQYMEPVASTPQEFAAYLKEELDRWGPIIRKNNIQLD